MSLVNTLRRHVLVVGVVAFVAIYGCFFALASLPEVSGWNETWLELGFAGLVLLVMALLCGLPGIRPSAQGVRYAWRTSRYMMLWSVAIGAIMLCVVLYENTSGNILKDDWPMEVLSTVLLCVGVGIFEEGLCRGLLFGSLLSRMGSTRRGIIQAVVISSTVFGFLHVWPNFVSGELDSAIAWGQALSKTFLGAGAFGAILAVIYLRTRNIWAIAFLHGLNDLVTMIPMAISSRAPDIHYVDADPIKGIVSIVVGIVMFLVITLPVFIKVVPVLKRVPAPQLGPYVDTWEPCVPEPDPKPAKDKAARRSTR